MALAPTAALANTQPERFYVAGGKITIDTGAPQIRRQRMRDVMGRLVQEGTAEAVVL